MTYIPHIVAGLSAVLFLTVADAQAQSTPSGETAAATVIQPAVDGVFEAFETYPLVGIGDNHGLVQNMDFYASLVRDARFVREVGNVVVEFGASRRQDVIDRYVADETVPYTELRTVWSDTVGWNPNAGNIGYAKFFAAVREINKDLPPEDRIRVWLGEPPFDWETATSEDVMRVATGERDSHPAQIIEQEILARGEKALVIYGGSHFGALPADSATIVTLVEARHPEAFFIVLTYTDGHQPAACAPMVERAAETRLPALIAPVPDSAPDPSMRECARAVQAGAPSPEMTPVIEGHGVLFHGSIDSLIWTAPGMPDTLLDAEYRREVKRRNGLTPFTLRPYLDDVFLRKADFEADLDAPGYSELLDEMFAEHDANSDGTITADEYVDPVP